MECDGVGCGRGKFQTCPYVIPATTSVIPAQAGIQREEGGSVPFAKPKRLTTGTRTSEAKFAGDARGGRAYGERTTTAPVGPWYSKISLLSSVRPISARYGDRM